MTTANTTTTRTRAVPESPALRYACGGDPPQLDEDGLQAKGLKLVSTRYTDSRGRRPVINIFQHDGSIGTGASWWLAVVVDRDQKAVAAQVASSLEAAIEIGENMAAGATG